MPELICNICRTPYKVELKDYKLLSTLTDNLCSAKCLVEQIKRCDPTNTPEFINYNNLLDYDVGTWWSTRLKMAFRSQFEDLTAQLLDLNKLAFKYEKYTFKVGYSLYTPDFFIPEYSCFLEVKGLWTMGKKKKMQKFMERYRNINFIIVPWILRESIYEATST